MPFAQSKGSVSFENIAAAKVTVVVEVIVDRGVNGGELL